MTVELTSVDDEGYELELDAVTEGPSEPTPLADGDGEADGADEVVLEQLERESEGRQQISPTSPLPVTSTLTTHTLLVIGLADGGPDAEGEQEQRQELRELVTFERH